MRTHDVLWLLPLALAFTPACSDDEEMLEPITSAPSDMNMGEDMPAERDMATTEEDMPVTEDMTTTDEDMAPEEDMPTEQDMTMAEDMPVDMNMEMDMGMVDPAQPCGDGSAPELLARLPSDGALGTGGGRVSDGRPLRRIGDDIVVEIEYPDPGVRLERLDGRSLVPVTPYARFAFSYYGDHLSPYVLVADDTVTLSNTSPPVSVYRMRTADVRGPAAWTTVSPLEPSRPGHTLSDPFVGTSGDEFVWYEDNSDGDLGGSQWRIYAVDGATGAFSRLHNFMGSPPTRVAYLGQPDGRHHWYNKTGNTLTHYAANAPGQSPGPELGSFTAPGNVCRWQVGSRDSANYYVRGTCEGARCGGGCIQKHFYILQMPFTGGDPKVLWEWDAGGVGGPGLNAGPYVDQGDGVYFRIGNFRNSNQLQPFGIVRVSKTPGATERVLAGSTHVRDFAVGKECIVQLNQDNDQLLGWPRGAN